jgi:hypothetical protein
VSFDPRDSALVVCGVPILDSEASFTRSWEEMPLVMPPEPFNQAAAARAGMAKGELLDEVNRRLAGSIDGLSRPERLAMIQKMALRILGERYALECRLDALVGEEKLK